MRAGRVTSRARTLAVSRWQALREDVIRWVTRRHRTDGVQAVITRDRVYILPTRQGYLLLLILLAMLLGSINYSNNMAFLLTFLIAGIGHNAMWYTHRNLLGLRVKALPILPVFAGQSATVQVRAEDDAGRDREALHLTIGAHHSRSAHLEANGSAVIEIPLDPLPRGRHELPRQRIATRYPLGLLEAWTWLTLDTEVLVYPRPIAGTPVVLAPDASQGEQAETRATLEGAPDEIRDYQPGDPPARIAWKAVARTGRLMVRDASIGEGTPVWLDWEHLPGTDIELRLSILCHEVLAANAGAICLGCACPGRASAPAQARNISRTACARSPCSGSARRTNDRRTVHTPRRPPATVVRPVAVAGRGTRRGPPACLGPTPVDHGRRRGGLALAQLHSRH
jgi:hypothetical protein